mmetsp:Transcript_62481/g.166188  ORF Transcript_62481/g.166188 Transcript_62481/m.166188 type:complete len:534 (+) Transcript_62481:141-1742(+)
MAVFATAASSQVRAGAALRLGALLASAALVASAGAECDAAGTCSAAAAGGLPGGLPAAVLAGAATEGVSLLQKPGAVLEKALPDDGGNPHLINLRRESVPIYRRGKVASFKTSYSGILHVGNPPQDFRVVFDTGSAHVVLPAAECRSESCLVHRRYNMSTSSTSLPINTDGSVVPEGQLCDQVTIGFGTGQVSGELWRERVCLAGAPAGGRHPEPPATAGEGGGAPPQRPRDAGPCVSVHTVMAFELSANPFALFPFDGILGLGLRDLSLNRNFSFFDILSESGLIKEPHFGIFLAEGDEGGEESELAVGGHNPARLLTPLSWSPVAMPGSGYWQVQILAVHVGNFTLPLCADGSCRGVVDTGTSHLGVPAPHDRAVEDLLTVLAGDLLDCRLAQTPDINIELEGFNLTLRPETYMRRLPLRGDVHVGSGPRAGRGGSEGPPATPGGGAPEDGVVPRFCRPRLMPVRLPAPVGPNVFIFGEPVLHHYYTAFDWSVPRIGFGLASTGRARAARDRAAGPPSRTGELPRGVDVYL